MNLKILASAMALTMATSAAFAIPARRDVVHTIVQPDGSTISLTRTGDEFNHHYLTLDKIPVLADASGRYCYATVSAEGMLVAGTVQASDPGRRSDAERRYIATLDLNAISSATSSMRRRNKAARASANQSSNIGLFESRFPHTGSPHGIVILVEFTDTRFKVPSPHEYYDDFLNGDNFTQHGGTGSVRKYFSDSSAGQFTPYFDVYGPVRMSHNTAYYGENDIWGSDKRSGDMVRDAINALDAEVDFSKYDTDSDGYVDNIYIIYAGKGENSYGSAETIWPHSWDLVNALGSAMSVDGVRINDYGCGNEWDDVLPTGIGTFCHEFGHVMGLPDLYNTGSDYSADDVTPGEWTIMDYGSYNNDGRTPCSYSIFERNAFGWINPTVLDGANSISLENIHDTNTGAIILTSSPNEFFLLENRQQTGWDTYVPGHGMLVWHIDYKMNIWDKNSPNNDATHQYIDIVEASGLKDNTDRDIMATYPFPGTHRVTSFTYETSPSLRTWSGVDLGLPLTDITETRGVISFDVAGGIVELDIPVATASEPTGNGFKLSWGAVDKATSYVVNVYTRDDAGNNIPAGIYKDYEVTDGTSLAVTRLQPLTKYYATVAAKRSNNQSAPSDEVEITTGEATFDILVPVTTPATNVTESSFTATWKPVEGATGYLLTVMSNNAVPEEKHTADFGTNNSLSLPQGWTSDTKDYYGSSANNYWKSAPPALKMSKLGHYLLTPEFDNDIVAVNFWVRNAGNSKTNYFDVLGLIPPTDGSAPTDDNWVLLHTHGQISYQTTGEIIDLSGADIPEGVRQVKLVFNKMGSGNMAVDDFTVTVGGTKAELLAGYDSREVGNVTSYEIKGLPAGVSDYLYYVQAINAAGLRSLVSEPMSVTLTGSGIADVETSAASVTAGHGTITIAGASLSRVCDTQGRTIATVSGDATVDVAPGLYIVNTDGTAHKIIVND